MGYNQFIDRVMGDDIQNQHQGVLHKGAKVLERGAKNIGGIGLQSFVAGTVTNLADHAEGVLNPIIDSGREIKGIANSDSKIKDAARFLFLHTPFAAVDSAVGAAKSVVGVPSKFMLRFPLRWYRDYANSNVGAGYDGGKGFWKTLNTAFVPAGFGLSVDAAVTGSTLGSAVTGAAGTSAAAAAEGTLLGFGALGTTATGSGISGITGSVVGGSMAASGTTLSAAAAANPLTSTAIGSAAIAPVADLVASGVHRTISNIRTSSIVSNRNNDKKDWYSNTTEYGKAELAA